MKIYLLPDSFQRLPAVIDSLRVAAAVFLIPILPADRANSLTNFATDTLHRQRKQNVLAQNLFKRNPVAVVKPHLRFALVNGDLFAIAFRYRTIIQLKIRIERKIGAFKATVAVGLHLG